MRAAILCFTGNGLQTAKRIAGAMEGRWEEVRIYGKSRFFEEEGLLIPDGLLSGWTGRMFEWADTLCFVGATGIAVRLIAPWVKDKRQDPAVLVTDEKGEFCIPLLSGHIGGANEQALYLSGKLSMTPVITTATDKNSCFAVDVFAKKRDLLISSMTYAREVSAALLAGEQVGFVSDFPVKGKLPGGLADPDGQKLGICVSAGYGEPLFEKTLWLIPRKIILGIGCRRGTPAEKIEALAEAVLKEEQIFREAVVSAATIDLKKEEEGLLQFCENWQLPLAVYTAEELSGAKGEFTSSSFVRSVTGVDNVCERSALLAAGEGKLIHRKTGRDGVTVALAVKEWSVDFE